MPLENKILSNIHSIKLMFVAEDEKRSATMKELQTAISLAKESDKISAVETGYLPYEDGYIVIKF